MNKHIKQKIIPLFLSAALMLFPNHTVMAMSSTNLQYIPLKQDIKCVLSDSSAPSAGTMEDAISEDQLTGEIPDGDTVLT